MKSDFLFRGWVPGAATRCEEQEGRGHLRAVAVHVVRGLGRGVLLVVVGARPRAEAAGSMRATVAASSRREARHQARCRRQGARHAPGRRLTAGEW